MYQNDQSTGLPHSMEWNSMMLDSSQHNRLKRVSYLRKRCNPPNQKHRMVMRWENEYLRIGGNRWERSTNYRNGFHGMITEGYLLQSVTKWPLSRITEPIARKLYPSPSKEVNEGRSIHSSFHSISLRIVNVFLKLYGLSLIVFRSSRQSPSKVLWPSWMDCRFGKSESSIHSFNHSQTQLNEHTWMHHHEVWLIVVEEDLWIQVNQPIKPVNENDGA